MIMPVGDTSYPSKCDITIEIPKHNGMPPVECLISINTNEKGYRYCERLSFLRVDITDMASNKVEDLVGGALRTIYNSSNELISVELCKELTKKEVSLIYEILEEEGDSTLASFITVATSFWAATSIVIGIADDIAHHQNSEDDEDEEN